MVSDAQLVERLREFLKTSDLTTTTTAIVRRKLEEDFDVDLTEKKAFIREQVDLFIQSQIENEKEEEEQEENERKTRQSSSEPEEEGEEEEEKESGDEGGGGKARRNGGGKRKGVVTKRAGGTGFSKLCALSPELQKFLGVTELARTEVVKQLWVYIRENNLQDPNNRRNINCDKKLRTLFDVDAINMFQMNKVLSKHIHPLDTNNGSDKSVEKEKQPKQERRGPDESKSKEKRRKGESSATSAFLAPLPLSDALVKFIGTGESKLPRSEVVKRMWNYIKENKLQDPSDKRRIICDEKLKELFEVDSFVGFTAPKLLVPHVNPKE